MAQASVTSQASGSLNTNDGVFWTKIIGGVIGIISLILQDHADQYLVDRVTIVRGFAELSLMYPNNAMYRQRVTGSLLRLSEALCARDDVYSATQVKSLHDRCRKFDETASRRDDGLALHRGNAGEFRRGPDLSNAESGVC